MKNRIDFTNCRVVLNKAFGGANGKKISVDITENFICLNFHRPVTINQLNYHIQIAV